MGVISQTCQNRIMGWICFKKIKKPQRITSSRFLILVKRILVCQLILSIEIDPTGSNGVINHVQKISKLEKQIGATQKGEMEGEHGKYRSLFSGASSGFWALKNREKKNDSHSCFPLNMTYISFLFFFSWQVPQIIDMNKKSLLPPAISTVLVPYVLWGPNCPILLMFPARHPPPDPDWQVSSFKYVMPDNTRWASKSHSWRYIRIIREALGEETNKPTHFQAVLWTNGTSISTGEIWALITFLKLPSDYNV